MLGKDALYDFSFLKFTKICAREVRRCEFKLSFALIGLPWWLTVKSLPARQQTWVLSLGWEDPLEKRMATYPVFFPGEFYGQRSLAGCNPWDHKQSDVTE